MKPLCDAPTAERLLEIINKADKYNEQPGKASQIYIRHALDMARRYITKNKGV